MNVFDEELPIPNLLRSDHHVDMESEHTDEHGWSKDLEKQLENIRENAVQQSAIAKKQYLELVHIQKYFKIPVIVISSLNSIASISLNAWMDQNAVSLTTCFLSFIVATMGSIELYLGISRKIEISLASFQSFYLLSIKINSTLKLEREHRSVCNGQKFLDDCLNEYEQLFTSNNVSPININDRLIDI